LFDYPLEPESPPTADDVVLVRRVAVVPGVVGAGEEHLEAGRGDFHVGVGAGQVAGDVDGVLAVVDDVGGHLDPGGGVYSSCQRPRENGLNPYQYIKYLLEQLPVTSFNNLEPLLPWSPSLPDSCKVPVKTFKNPDHN